MDQSLLEAASGTDQPPAVDHEEIQNKIQKHIDLAKKTAGNEIKEALNKHSSEARKAVIQDAESRHESDGLLNRGDLEAFREKYRILDTHKDRFGVEAVTRFWHWLQDEFAQWWYVMGGLVASQRPAAMSDLKTEQMFRELAVWNFLSQEYLPFKKQPPHDRGERAQGLEQVYRAEFMEDHKDELAKFLLTKITGSWHWDTTTPPQVQYMRRIEREKRIEQEKKTQRERGSR
ncbi:MAG: hypothetical protein Q9218_006975 [Villophora microphyllina]